MHRNLIKFLCWISLRCICSRFSGFEPTTSKYKILHCQIWLGSCYRRYCNSGSSRSCPLGPDLDRLDARPDLGGADGEDVGDVARDSDRHAVQRHQVDRNSDGDQVRVQRDVATSCLRHFLKMDRSRPICIYFCLFCLNVQLVDKTLPMSGFKPHISGVRSGRSTN